MASIGGDTLGDLEDAATVGLAASFTLATCGADDDVRTVLSNERNAAFDHFPVKRSQATVGVLSREDVRGIAEVVQVVQVMRPLDDRLLVSKKDPLLETFEHMTEGPAFRLVIDRNEIRGILTLSDLDKLPVRALVFSRVTHVELLLADYIRKRARGVDVKWLTRLDKKRQNRALRKFNGLKKQNEELDLLQATEFCDKRDAAVALGLRAGLGKKAVERMLRRVEELRNRVAHATTLVAGPERAREIAGLLKSVRPMIEAIQVEIDALA